MGTTSGSGKIARFDPAVYREVTELRSLLEQTHKVIDTLENSCGPAATHGFPGAIARFVNGSSRRDTSWKR